MSRREDLLDEFIEITGVDTDRANFFLESSAWSIEVALASFYEHYASSGGERNTSSDATNGSDTDCEEVGAAGPPPPKADSPETCRPVTRPKPSSRIGTIAALRSSESSDAEDREAFYAGGSEHSGQQVLGPEMNQDDEVRKRRDIIAQMIKAAHERGEMPEEPHRSQAESFTGIGYRLGQSNEDSNFVVNPGNRQSNTEENRAVTLKLWQEGFSIDDGPLREYSTPENLAFLNTIRRGRIPDELLSEARGGTVHLNMEDHRTSKYKPPAAPKVKAFSGRGHVLGSLAPAISSDDEKQEQAPPAEKCSENDLKSILNVDENKATTVIQVRLADGSRLIATLNHDHTVADLRKYIILARPQYRDSEFSLSTTYPSKELNDEQTLIQAGILNSSILQRLK